jgi:hypothetical protein
VSSFEIITRDLPPPQRLPIDTPGTAPAPSRFRGRAARYTAPAPWPGTARTSLPFDQQLFRGKLATLAIALVTDPAISVDTDRSSRAYSQLSGREPSTSGMICRYDSFMVDFLLVGKWITTCHRCEQRVEISTPVRRTRSRNHRPVLGNPESSYRSHLSVSPRARVCEASNKFVPLRQIEAAKYEEA